MKLEQSKTCQNLMTAYLRESGAYNEYIFYAEQAKQDGFESIYNVFNKFANNEQAHAKIWFQLFHGICGTLDNLKDAKDLEHYENSTMYVEFAEQARQEGFIDIARLFEGVAVIEKQHEETYKRLQLEVKNKEVFVKKEENTWQCLNCGHIHVGKEPPETCPICSYSKAYFTTMKQ